MFSANQYEIYLQSLQAVIYFIQELRKTSGNSQPKMIGSGESKGHKLNPKRREDYSKASVAQYPNQSSLTDRLLCFGHNQLENDMKLERMEVTKRGEGYMYAITDKNRDYMDRVAKALIEEFDLEDLTDSDEYRMLGGLDMYDEKDFRETYKELKKTCK